jgi:Na+-driven multidrug efflux pump
MTFGIVTVISVSLVDTYCVGRLGTLLLATLSFTFPVTLSVSSLAIRLGAGAWPAMSRAAGSKDTKDAKRLATDGIILVMMVPVAG